MAIALMSQFDIDNKDMNQIFEDACELSNYDCDGVEQPIVRRSSQLESTDMYGLYIGGKILWVGSKLMPLRAHLTMFHEVVHYLQVNVGGTDLSFINDTGICVVEREAMQLTNTYARMKKMPKAYIRTVEEWKEIYGC
ncbi:MAG: hypothetical protein V3W09_03840 [Nitrososphaerales archaeon]